ncbi:MAG: hypothetical protein AAFQ43_04155 [Bacteroidota bacterium]
MSVWFPKNRGKVRGWRRRARHVDEWRRRHLAPDDTLLDADGRDWAKLYLAPWYRLARREPPAWLRRRIVAALVDVHAAWHQHLDEREPAEPFDCMLWLLAPFVIESQVVAASGDMRAFYRDTFPPASDDVPPTPPEAVYGSAVRGLRWSPVLVPGYTTQEDLDEDAEWARVFERRHCANVLSETEAHGTTQITFRVGHGWIGRLPGSSPA